MALTNQDWVAFSLDGSNELGRLKRIGASSSGNIVDGAAGTSGTFKACETSRAERVTFELLTDVSGECRGTNLDLTILTLGGSDYAPTFKGGSITMSLSAQQSTRAVASLKARAQATQRKFDFRGQWWVDSETLIDLESLANSADPADRDMTVILTVAGIPFNCAMTMESFEFSSEVNGLHLCDVSFSSRAAPTAPSSGFAAVAFTGDNLYTLVSDTGSGDRSGTGLCESMTITVPEDGLVTISGTMLMQGGYTLAAS